MEIETNRLNALASYHILDSPREKFFDDLTLLASQLFDVPIVTITLVAENRQWFKSSVGVEVDQTDRCFSFCSHIIQHASPLIIEDASQDERFSNNSVVTGDTGIRFYAGIPLITKDGFALGSFCIIDHIPRQLSCSQLALLQLFADHVMVLFEQRYESIGLKTLLTERDLTSTKLKSYAEHLSEAQRIAKIGSWELDIQENTLIWSDEVYRLFNVDKNNVNLTFEKFMSFVHPEDVGIVLIAQELVLKGVAAFDIEHRIVLDDKTELYVHELAELKCVEGNGVIKLCGTVKDITEKKAMEKRIDNLVFYDSLTNLPNRQLFADRLLQAQALIKRDSKRGALIYLDLDNFKVINDALGHDMGNLLLKNVAIRIGACIRIVDTLARIGGDEFTILLGDLSPQTELAADQARTVANTILTALQEPFKLAEHTYYVTASVGVAMFSKSTQDVEVLLKRADLAMYKAKSLGKNTIEFFDHDLQVRVINRVAIEKDLRHALLNDQFKLFYQPQVDQDNNVVGCEALIRWFHPDQGFKSPADFIPIAEETGLIVSIGKWVIETACKQLNEWKLAGKTHLSIAVNVSPKQFRQTDFVETVLSFIIKYDLDSTKLKLELTESMLVDNIEDIKSKMYKLKENGICFSLDDFGTGYSSLNYLSKLPIDQLKIDQSFVRNMIKDQNDAVIVKIIISLGHSLGLSVIAEGVETIDQQRFLAKHNCNLYQGYLFCKPLSIEELNKLILL